VGGASEIVDPDGRPICVLGDPQNSGLGTAICRRTTAIEVGGIRPQFLAAEDTDLQLRMSENGRAVYLHNPMIRYRQHYHSTTFAIRQVVMAYRALARKMAEERRSCGTDAIQRGEEVQLETLCQHVPEAISQTFLRWAWWALGAGNVATARKYAVEVAIRQPFSLASWRLLACAVRGH
jgi:GT2 family glycosyltransferase